MLKIHTFDKPVGLFMKVEKIVEVVGCSLMSVKYDSDDTDSFDKFLDQMNDNLWLDEFFTKHDELLQSDYYRNKKSIKSIRKAVEVTQEEVLEFEDLILESADKVENGEESELDAIFKPLYNGEKYGGTLQFSKIQGLSHIDGWLRVYAIRIEKSCFIITGGTIKLTEKMEPEHLQDELVKLKLVKRYLVSEGIIDKDSMIDLLENQ